MVLRKMLELANSDLEVASSWLLIGALFFAMRSCEYLQTGSSEKKRTKIITVGNITFKKKNRILSHSSKHLASADLVRIRFCYQKNDKRDVCIHMFKSGDKVLCPVIAWAAIVKRVRNIEGSNDNSEVCLFMNSSGQTSLVRADYVRTRLRAIVDLIGEVVLGFGKLDIGLHSIRSGGAMAMFLSGVSVIIIQRVGRWSSEAFLEYIRDQVESFTLGVSKRMLQFEEFLNLNEENPQESSISSDLIVEGSQNEDGPDSVPFQVRFSEFVLNNMEKGE